MSGENKKLVSATLIDGKKNRKNHLARHVILSVLFLFAILFCSAIAAGLSADNFVTENILATSGLVLAIFLIIPFEKWLVYREAHSRHPVLPPVLLILAVFAVTFAMMAHQLGKSPSAIASGKNVNACGYTHDFTDYGSRDLEKLIQEKYSKSEGIPVARIDLRDYHEVFLLSENEITTYEFAEQNKKYFYLGTRKLVYRAAYYPLDSYSWQETVFADASESCLSHGIRLFKNGDSDPAWGVTDFNPRKSVQIKGRYPDQVTKLETDDGSAIYLWIYNDLNNTAELKLEDVTVTNQ